ncbi:uncharacterized protein LOC131652388 [Vicia villosa]|uniref:uncharacterized protein LOC131652388 n=1 Tax=Vicia villosa TaxID=3911 RepID=UPI00273CA2AB|nr:uncharacterized protein LOC131652388 [Vicia villosa]
MVAIRECDEFDRVTAPTTASERHLLLEHYTKTFRFNRDHHGAFQRHLQSCGSKIRFDVLGLVQVGVSSGVKQFQSPPDRSCGAVSVSSRSQLRGSNRGSSFQI